jgi:hypothetical protein
MKESNLHPDVRSIVFSSVELMGQKIWWERRDSNHAQELLQSYSFRIAETNLYRLDFLLCYATITSRSQNDTQLITLYSVCQGEFFGRSTRIRTLDPLVPNQVRYQTALHSEKIIGSPGWDRTTDILINSQAQLPLCYWGIHLVPCDGIEPPTFSL